MLTEQEAAEYREQSEKGRQAKTALEFLSEYLTGTRALVFHELETLQELGNAAKLILFLQVLRDFENSLIRYADTGEIAERKLNEDGE